VLARTEKRIDPQVCPESGGAVTMEMRIEHHHTVDVLAISGRLDLVSSSTLKDMIRQRLADRRVHIVLDMDKVPFINSSGLGALISALRDIRLSGGRIALCRMAPYLEEIFNITGLTRVFDCYATIPEALESFSHLTELVSQRE
jgi:anti-sigma B factor antagonist